MQKKGYPKNKRRGVASAIGILFMVGILMTSIIPMFMYVNQVNNHYDRTVVEMKNVDDERGREDLEVYAYGVDESSISVWLRNKGSVSVKVNHIWVIRNDLKKAKIFDSSNLPLELVKEIPASSIDTILDLNLEEVLATPEENKFNIYVATERGNKFSSETNTLAQSVTGWNPSTVEFLINVMIHSGSTSDYRIEVYDITVDPEPLEPITWKEIRIHVGTGYTIINAPSDGIYRIELYKSQGGWIYVGAEERTLTWIHPATWVEFNP